MQPIDVAFDDIELIIELAIENMINDLEQSGDLVLDAIDELSS